MNKIVKKILIIICIFSLVFITSCKNGELAVGDTKYNFSVNSNEINLEVGENFQIFATYGDCQISYDSVDPNIATVTQGGEVVGVSEGITYILLDAEKEVFNIKVVVKNSKYSIELYEETSFVVIKNAPKTLSVVLKKDGVIINEKLTFSCDKSKVKITQLTNLSASVTIKEVGLYEIKVIHESGTSLIIPVKVMSENAKKLETPVLNVLDSIISWESNENASGYMIKVDNDEWQLIKDTSYDITGMIVNNIYIFAVSNSFDYFNSNIANINLP